jgi:hypothetical protein
MVSVRSTDKDRPAGAGAAADGSTAEVDLTTGEAVLTASGLTALLEITKRRRAGAVFTFETFKIFGLLLLLRGALLDAVTLRFNINFQTKIPSTGSEKCWPDGEIWLLTKQPRSWEQRTPED